jgi:hypothetical protein
MKFKQRFSKVLETLGLTAKAKSKELTIEDWDKIAASYKETHNVDMYADMAADAENAEKAKQHDLAMSLFAEDNDGEQDETPENTEKGGGAKPKGKKVDLATEIAKIKDENKELKTSLQTITEKLNDNGGEHVMEVKFDATGLGLVHSDTHLFGVKSAIYDRSRRWNQLFENPGAIHTMGEAQKDVQDQFFADFSGFASSVAKAVANLHAAGMLNKEVLRNSSNPSLTGLVNAGLGDQFVQFRVREIVARVLELPDPFGIFPMRSNIQDRDLITNAFVGELTQAFQDSETSLKGSSALEPEMGYVDDAMILSKFGSFKDMERKYIAYLNTNGSDPVKWGQIEYFMLLYMVQARKEQFQRVVRGIYLKPVAGTPGHYLNASTGQIPRMIMYHIEKKLRGLEDASMATYDGTGTVMIDMLIEFGQWLKEQLDPLGVEVDQNLAIYANKNHRPWFKSGYRAKYNLHGDFTGIEDTKIPDTEIPIIWVPNMGSLKIVWATVPGNQQCLENLPGEMFNFYLERRLNNVYVQSTWKEGAAAGYAGRQSATKAALDSRDWDQQMIWFPKPYSTLAADAVAADALNGFWFKTVQNTVDTAITGVTNKAAGQLYIVECGHLTKASTITKAGDFSEITADFVPVAVGDLLAFVWDAGASKYKEICRVVNGVLAYNSATTPNAIGAR